MQNQWYIARDGKQYGPITDADLSQLVQKKELLDSDFLWRQGFDNWLSVAQVPEVRDFAQQFNRSEVPPAQTPPQQGSRNFSPSDNSNEQDQVHNAEQGQNPNQTHDFAKSDVGALSGDFSQGMGETDQGQNQFSGSPQSQSPEEPDLTNQSLTELTTQYPALHESEAGVASQNTEVQDLIEEEEDPLHKPGLDERGQARGLAVKDNQPQGPLHAELSSQPITETSQQPVNFSARSIEPASQQKEIGQHQEQHPQGASSRDMSAGFHAGQQPFQPGSQSGDGFSHMSAGAVAGSLNGAHEQRYQNSPDGQEQRAHKKSGFSWPLGLGIGIAALFILIIGATFALPYIVPPETIKSQITAAIKDKTGRDVTFKGKISYRFFPSFGIDLNNIIIHNPQSIKGPNFLQLGRLQADLKILPLLSKRIEIGRIIMHRPEFALIKDPQGRVNYEFKKASLRTKNFNTALLEALGVKAFSKRQKKTVSKYLQIAQAQETLDTSDIIARTLEQLEKEEQAEAKTSDKNDESSAEKAKGPDVDAGELEDVKQAGLNTDIIIGEIEIVNGAVKLIDQKANSETLISAINVSVQAPDLAKDVTAKGTLRYLEDRINLGANLSTLGQLLQGEDVVTNVTLNSDRFEGKFDGKVRYGSKLEFNGNADVQTYSLQNLLSWLGVDVPKRGYGGAYARGELSGTPDVFQLANATIKVDNSVLAGAVGLRSSGARPTIRAQLKTDLLDLSPYMQQQAFIHRDLIKGLNNPRKTAIAAWKSEKIDVSFLNKFDALVQLTASRLIIQKHRLENAQVGVKVNAGLMTAQMPKFSIYGGTGALNLSVNGAKPRPTLKGRIGLKQIQIQPLLKNAADLNWLSGVGNVDLDIVSSGTSEQQMISALNGTGRITVADGAVEGVNIPGMIRNVQKGRLLEPFSKPQEKTDFSDLQASFTINSGVVENKDLLMKGPLLRMTGKGILNLPGEQIDYGVQPKLVNSLAGQGGEAALAGINIPIRIKGPMNNPQFIPDAKGLLENNGEAINNTVKSVKKTIKDIKKKKISGEEMKGLLNGLIDGNQDSGQLLDGILN
jgi:AsmA protein